jgi:hypothetical protein
MLVSVTGGTAHPLGAITQWLGATVYSRRRDSGIGWQHYHLVGSGGTARAGAGPGRSARVVPPALLSTAGAGRR